MSVCVERSAWRREVSRQRGQCTRYEPHGHLDEQRTAKMAAYMDAGCSHHGEQFARRLSCIKQIVHGANQLGDLCATLGRESHDWAQSESTDQRRPPPPPRRTSPRTAHGRYLDVGPAAGLPPPCHLMYPTSHQQAARRCFFALKAQAGSGVDPDDLLLWQFTPRRARFLAREARERRCATASFARIRPLPTRTLNVGRQTDG